MSFVSTLDSYTAHQFLAPENLAFADDAVASVFALMLGLHVAAISPVTDTAELDRRTAIVGFSGSLSGSCELHLSSRAARAVTSAMLRGTLAEDEDESVDDAVGELCNMIAGGWKNRIVFLASTCALSPPAVISGYDYRIHTNSAALKIVRTYSFADGLKDQTLRLTLRCLGRGTL